MKPLSFIRKVKAEKEERLFAIPDVTGVDIGPKIVNGVKTKEMSIRVYVKKKKKTVPDKEKIPATIDGVKTDVIEKTFVLHPCAVPLADISLKADTTTYNPLVGGISIGPCTSVGGFVFTGTLGCMVKDRTTQEVLMLSNYHVMAEKWSNGEQQCQPSRVDTGSCPGDVVGSLVRSVISENVDGAVASISNRSHECSIHEIGDVKGKNTATPNMKVRKRGRTTGFTHGIVDSVDASVSVLYDHGTQILKNQILIDVDTSQSTQFGNSGDSGSVVVDENNKVVGLYFAGTEDGSLGVANPIDAVLDELNVNLCVVQKFYWEGWDKLWMREEFKNWIREDWKDRLKEVSYDKPPFSERIDWDWRWRTNPPTTGPFWGRSDMGLGGSDIASIEARLQNLETLLSQGPPPHFGGPPPAFKAPWKEKLEKPESKEVKEKPERKETKEGKEFKEFKEFKEGKEKPERKENKEFKEFKEGKEKPEPKEIFEGGGNFPGGGFPQGPGSLGPQPQAGSSPLQALEERLARLEAMLYQQHFIGPQLRPDLTGGALRGEPDYGIQNR